MKRQGMSGDKEIHRSFSWLILILLAVLPRVVDAGQPPDDLTLQLLADGFVEPLAYRSAGDGSGRGFIVERAGRIWIYDSSSDSVLPTPFLDIRSRVDASASDQGLLGLAFHPQFAANGQFYINYTRNHQPEGLDRSVVARYSLSAMPNLADPHSEVVVLEFEQPDAIHNSSDLHFGPDGYLYIASGDGGPGRDLHNAAQNRGTLLGKILRLDVDGTPPSPPNDLCGLVTNYGIPPSNPLLGSTGACDEIWSLGWRNPWRFSFDRRTGDLFFGDVGQGTMEEVDFEPAPSSGGANYGWRCLEGTSPFNNHPPCPGPLVPPVLTHAHSAGFCSLIGGYRYRGSVIAGLRGLYIYGDLCPPGPIWLATHHAEGHFTSVKWRDTGLTISSFGEDEDGELLVIDITGGAVYRLVSPSSIFADDFEVGDVSVWTPSTSGTEDSLGSSR